MKSWPWQWATWRIAARDRIARLCEAMDRVPEASQKEADYTIARISLTEAQQVSGMGNEGQTIATGPAWLSWFTGTVIERTWSALHRTEEALLMVAADAAVRMQAVGMRAAIAHWPAGDARTPAYQKTLDDIVAGTGQVTREQREALRAIREAIDTRSDGVHARQRAFRNILLGFSVVLAVVVVVCAIGQGATSTSAFSTCSVTAQASSPCRSAGEIELVAGFGGLISALVFVRGLQTASGPYNLAVAQSILKIVGGSAIGLFGVLLVQHGVLDILAPQDNNRVLGYALLFGFAQQLVTQAADKRAADLTAPAASARQGAGGSSGPAQPANS